MIPGFVYINERGRAEFVFSKVLDFAACPIPNLYFFALPTQTNSRSHVA